MFEYKFVKQPIKKILTSSKTTDNTTNKIKEIIDLETKNGWRFVQIFSQVGEGLISTSHYEIIFERET